MIKKYLELVKFSHSIFALPFALIGYALGVVECGFSALTLLGVVGCMILARTSAMAFNRLVDREFDAANPRTASREIPSGRVSVVQARWLVLVSGLGFMVVAGLFNTLTLWLSPLALAVVLGYSYTKRFTSLCHVVLGLGLSIAPMGAYIAVTGSFGVVPMLVALVVLSWVSGFDIIFALQDVEFDRGAKLRSIPSRVGVRGGLIISAVLHILTVLFTVITAVVLMSRFAVNGPLLWIGTALFWAMLAYQHLILRPSDLSRVNLAFGTTNGVASVIYATFVILSLAF